MTSSTQPAHWPLPGEPEPSGDAGALREKIARIIYDDLERPVANQDFGRQCRQWEQCLRIADAILKALSLSMGEGFVHSSAKEGASIPTEQLKPPVLVTIAHVSHGRSELAGLVYLALTQRAKAEGREP